MAGRKIGALNEMQTVLTEILDVHHVLSDAFHQANWDAVDIGKVKQFEVG